MHYVNLVSVRGQNAWFALRYDESGATMVEYGLMVALIAVLCVGAVAALGGSLGAFFSKAGSSIGGTTTTVCTVDGC